MLVIVLGIVISDPSIYYSKVTLDVLTSLLKRRDKVTCFFFLLIEILIYLIYE